MQDLRYALRTLRKQPVFTFVAVLTLALGIGANTAIFSLLYQAILRPLPYREANRLVFVWNSWKDGGKTNVAIPDYLDRRVQAPAIEDATLFTARNATLSISGRPEQLVTLAVTPSFFSTLGRGPQLGRAFTEDEAVPGANRRVILTAATWRARFGGDPDVVGRSIQLNGQSHEVVGVLPADFELPLPDITLLTPFAFTPAQMSDQGRGDEVSFMIARLHQGATIEQLNGQMQAIVARLIDRLPARAAYMRNSGFTGVAVPIRDQLVGDARGPLLLLQGGVLLVLLIACANVANLLLMRATGRSRELAIRTTLGADPWRIVRQLLVEGTVLACLGAAGGIALAAFGVRALVALIADVRSLDEWRARALQPRRTPATLLALFGAVALLLSAIGIYGVYSFAVAERVREFGIRQALGADRASILSLVLKQGARTTATGVALGLGGAALLTRYLQSLLFGVSTRDAGVFAAASVTLIAVALLACYIPARRATRVDPMVALRN